MSCTQRYCVQASQVYSALSLKYDTHLDKSNADPVRLFAEEQAWSRAVRSGVADQSGVYDELGTSSLQTTRQLFRPIRLAPPLDRRQLSNVTC